jgi:hypothetical protein
MIISNKAYDILNFMAKVIGPIVVFIAAFLSIWQIPYAEQITATLAALETLLGSLVHVLKVQYDKSEVKKNGTLN